MTLEVMYDSIRAEAIPVDAKVVAGYVDGLYAWSTEDWARFADVDIRVRIATSVETLDADVLDVEKGDATPADAPAWVEKVRSRAGSYDAMVYCSLSNWDACKKAFADAVVPQPEWWIAEWDGVAELPAGAVAKQYQSTPLYDLSVIDTGLWRANTASKKPEREKAAAKPASAPTAVDHKAILVAPTLQATAHQLQVAIGSDSRGSVALPPGEVLSVVPHWPGVVVLSVGATPSAPDGELVVSGGPSGKSVPVTVWIVN
ncbi:MAG: hypothetical protein ACYCV4_02450 [Dermatophilaceae bacterium]